MGMKEEFTPAERALIIQGFEAVPALLNQRQSKRFTNHLMEGFNNFLSYPTSYPSWLVAEAVMESAVLTKQLKIELLLAAIATDAEAHRNTGLQRLRDLDPPLADAQLLGILKKAPNSAKKDYWTDQDANLGRLVSASLKPDVWKAFHALLDRADLGMRMELIDHLYPPHGAPTEILNSFYRVYDRFSNDKTLRDESTSQKFSGPGAGFPHEKIEMRDFLHEHWARWMKLELKAPKRGASPIEWEEYRDKVSLAIKQYRAEQGVPLERR